MIAICVFIEAYPISFVFCPTDVSKLPTCAAGFALLNLPKGKSLGRSKPETNS